jgi:hypothetical protein
LHINAWRRNFVWGKSAAADGGEYGDLVVVVEGSRVAVGGLVAVHPHARALQHRGELVAVAAPCQLEQLAELGGVELVGSPAGRFPRLREQTKPDGQGAGSVPNGDADSVLERRGGSVSTLVRAAGTTSRRSGSMVAPVTSSMP